MPAGKWFNITRNSATTASIDIFDEIGSYGISAKNFITELRALKGVKNITLKIDCPGGDCNDGFTIFDALKASGATITADIIGCAASMASVIMLAASKIRIAENGRVMIHRVTAGAYGNADNIDAAAKVARQFEDRIVQLYMARTGSDEDTVRDLMKAELGTWFFGDEAVTAKFADELITGVQARAFQPRWAKLFTMLPAALFDITSHSSPNPETSSIIAMTEAELKAAEQKLKADQIALEQLQADATAAANKLKADAQAEADKIIADAKKKSGETTPENIVTLDTINKTVLAQQEEIKNLKARIDQGVTPQNLAGGKPADNVPSTGAPQNEMKHEDWKNLSIHERQEFFRKGGKLV